MRSGTCFTVILIIGLVGCQTPNQKPVVGASFRDCSQVCPEMVVIPPGDVMVAPRGRADGNPRRVAVAVPLVVGKFDVTRDEFAAFVTASGYEAEGCYTYDGGKLPGALFHQDVHANWRHVGFNQTGRDPVVCVNLADAIAYTRWLSQKTGKHYRLLTDDEWQYAARGRATSIYGWDAPNVHDLANIGMDSSCCRPAAIGRDRWLFTSPVGSFNANGFGLYDMLGNVEQWTETCSKPPIKDASACAERVLRGQGWLASMARDTGYSVGDPTTRESSIGFRVARDL